MALPTSRNTTYAAGVSQVKSADLNDLQDQIIALYKLIAPVRHLYKGDAHQTAALLLPVRLAGNRWGSNSGGNREACFPLRLPVGVTVNQIDIEVDEGAGGAAPSFYIEELDAGATNQLGDTITFGTTGNVVTMTWDDTTNDSVNEIPFTTAAGKTYRIRAYFPSSGQQAVLNDIKVTLDY